MVAPGKRVTFGSLLLVPDASTKPGQEASGARLGALQCASCREDAWATSA